MYNRKRNVLDDQQTITRHDRVRHSVNRQEARSFFQQSFAKAHETEVILDGLGEGFRLDISGASDHLRNLVRILDPESEGNYISWETYKRAVDISIASSFPDVATFVRSQSADVYKNNEILETLINEQVMSL